MDNNTWRPTEGEPSMDTGDWRSQLPPVSRLRNVNIIMETLGRIVLVSGPGVLQELGRIAIRFEKKVYVISASQADYVRKISVKMRRMERYFRTPDVPGSLPSNLVGGNQNQPEPDTI